MQNNNNSNTKRGRKPGQSRSQIQFVSFLSWAGLLAHLHRLHRDGAIGHYWAVEHEADEEDHKAHQHVRLYPPLGRSVVWADIVETITEDVVGESLPRKCVCGSKAINDNDMDGLLYARHDSRYLACKGLVKAHVDYGRERFATDDIDWFKGVWAQSDAHDIQPKRLTAWDIMRQIDADPGMSLIQLLRLCLASGLRKTDYDMLREYQYRLHSYNTQQQGNRDESDN